MASARESAPLVLAVLISGGGTTLRNLLDRIASGTLAARVATVVSSTPSAKGLQIAEQAGIETHVVRRGDYATVQEYGEAVFAPCRAVGAQLVAMGGFLKLVQIPHDYRGRVLNIHPSLIPAFCGEGYYGLRVHQAALDYGVKLTGCTVHFVDDHYDHGPIVLQRPVEVLPDDTAQTLAARVFAAECEAFPEAIGLFAAGRLRLEGRRVSILPAF